MQADSRLSGEGVGLLTAAGIKDVSLSGQGSKSAVVSDKGVVTAAKASSAAELAKKFVQAISMHRFWEREKTDKIPA